MSYDRIVRATTLVLVWAMTSAATALGAPAPRFQYERSVVPAAAGPNRLAVDVSLLGGAKALVYGEDGVTGGLEDLRLFDPNGHEVGYLVIPPAAPSSERWQPGTTLAIPATDAASGFEVDLGAPLTIDRLRIDGITPPFLKRARLEGSCDRERWVVLNEAATVFDLPSENLKQTVLRFSPTELRYVRLTWDDRNSAVVALPSAVSAHVPTTTAVADSTRVTVGFERRPSEPGVSRYRLRLPAPQLPISALELGCGGGHLLRDARVMEARLQGEVAAPVKLGSRTLQRAVQGELTAADLRIPIKRPAETELDLIIVDGDNPPLELLTVEAELSPLPWIYFESADGASLTARFGDVKLERPRYDLEAMRASVTRVPVNAAKWGEIHELTPPPPEEPSEPTEDLAGGGASIDVTQFTHRRSIAGGPLGLTALVLDPAVLAHSNHLRDVRIADSNGHQVPYLSERLGEPQSIALEMESMNGAGQQKGSVYRVSLPYASLPAGRLVLSTTARVFERLVSVQIERLTDDLPRKARTITIASAGWRHTDPQRKAPDLVLNLPPLNTTEIDIVIDEGDNSPLPLAAPRLLLSAHRLRFYRVDGKELTLLYGQRGLGSPRYDLALLAPRVFGGSANEVHALPDSPAAKPRVAAATRDRSTILFWSALAGAVVVLLLLIARLVVKSEEGPDTSGPTSTG